MNECGAKGSFYELCKHFGENTDKYNDRPVQRKIYKAPKVETQPVQSHVEKYLTSRGFSKDTWESRGVCEVNGAIALPYYENKQLVLMKYRTPEKSSKHWREPDGKPVFWGMDMCSYDKPLIITEGEMDTLALDECGITNVVSVPSGSSDLTCIELCWEWLEKFNKVIIWGDNDQAGKDMIKNLIMRLGQWRCALVESPYKDANIHLYREGKESCIKAVKNAREVPVNGIVKVADVKRVDVTKIPRVLSCIQGINKALGGYRMGELSVWTGINSAGKSTLLGQEIIESIDQGFTVFAYSGELSQWMFKDWIHTQMCGTKHLEVRRDEIRDKAIGRVASETAELLEDWYKDQFYLYDSYSTDEGQLMELCEIAARKYGCRVFLLDNLMSTGLAGIKADNMYQAQSEFVRRMAAFAKKYDSHVHVVAHPRKTEGKLTKMDISGSGDITNRADNVISVHRFSDGDKKKENFPEAYRDLAGLVQIFKNRFYGTQDVEIGVAFDEISKRFYNLDDGIGPDKEYGWVRYLGEQPTIDRLGIWGSMGRVIDG
jgi:twinkle protein